MSKWTKEEDRFLKANYGKIKNIEIAKILNRTNAAIDNRLKNLGIKRLRKTKKWTDEASKFLIESADSLSYNDIAKVLGYGFSTVVNKAKELGINKKIIYQKTPTKAELEFIRENFDSMSYDELAEATNRSYDSIRMICNSIGLQRIKRYSHNHKFFDKWSPEMAYVLGFVTADGTVLCNYEKKQYRLCVRLQQKDECILEYIKSLISPEVPIYHHSEVSEITGALHRYSTISISSKYMAERLVELGVIPNKTGKESLPTIPDEFKSYYLLGLFDGDGCISSNIRKDRKKKSRRWIFGIHVASKQFLDDVKKILGFNFGVVEYRPKNHCYVWTINKVLELSKIFEFLYGGSPDFFLKRKYEKFLEFYSNRVLESPKHQNFKKYKSELQICQMH